MNISYTNSNPAIPIGSSRIWNEGFVNACADKISVPTNWIFVGEVNAINIKVKVPKSSGIYAFVRRSRIEQLTPFGTSPLIVYIGLAKDLRQRLLKYVDEKRAALRYTKGAVKVRSGIRLMFNTYGEALEVYFFECNQIDLVAVEDLLIKLFDPIFNEEQKLTTEITEANEYLVGSITSPESAYTSEIKPFGSGARVQARLSSPVDAF